jgi:hypothetical protein
MVFRVEADLAKSSGGWRGAGGALGAAAGSEAAPLGGEPLVGGGGAGGEDCGACPAAALSETGVGAGGEASAGGGAVVGGSAGGEALACADDRLAARVGFRRRGSSAARPSAMSRGRGAGSAGGALRVGPARGLPSSSRMALPAASEAPNRPAHAAATGSVRRRVMTAVCSCQASARSMGGSTSESPMLAAESRRHALSDDRLRLRTAALAEHFSDGRHKGSASGSHVPLLGCTCPGWATWRRINGVSQGSTRANFVPGAAVVGRWAAIASHHARQSGSPAGMSAPAPLCLRGGAHRAGRPPGKRGERRAPGSRAPAARRMLGTTWATKSQGGGREQRYRHGGHPNLGAHA